MILLDTNVVSEFVKTRPDPNVVSWMDAHARRDFYLCAPVLAELRYGAALLPDGKRKESFLAAFEQFETEKFFGRILTFDRVAAYRYAALRAARCRDGRPLAVMDAVIAAIASAHAMMLATRNVRDFEGLGVPLVDPFSAG